MQTRIAKNEPIPGYHVRECLGTGGCGEVWKAEAPGGLTKAIKFVYGYHNDKRAAIELKALERIKEVRHPFLLSLERIEIIAGQLVIVTELADGSLRERFNECRREGLHGIPRPELLRYLRDTADALDFMTEQHSLQHLDVKPENLLLLSKRVKVADFGLVKNFRHVTASLMGGLTPLYAAPEVFHGSPSKCSDQYSLAVVYQELLTGLLPFQANSPAELTLLHLNEMPDLSSLPEGDRPVIARALAKDPSQRYLNCGDLVDALVQAGTTSVHPSAVAAPASFPAAIPTELPDRNCSTQPAPVYKTVICDHHTPLLGAVPPQSVSLDLPALPTPAVRELGQIDPASVRAPIVPTLILGIGGTAGYVLRHLRRRICEHHDNMLNVPAVSMLLLDTNPQSIAAASRGDGSTSLGPNETMELPLRRPQEYRADSERFLRWLGRRWLYNIPRSLKTEGLRPLGRLAFVDHYKEVVSRLHQMATAVTDSKSIAASEQRTGLSFQAGALRVYLVASISGGTGGGMAIDLAYAAQNVRDQLGLRDAGVIGLLIHFTTSNPRHGEVGLINSFSWLTEYDHFSRPGGRYPGDPSCGLPGVEADRRPFHHAYLTHIGDGLGEEDIMQATGPVADYIYLDLLTPARHTIEACRNAPIDAPPIVARQAPLRTFGLSRTSVVQHDFIEDAVTTLCRDTVAGWLGQCSQPDSAGRLTPGNLAIRSELPSPDKGEDPLRGCLGLLSLDSLLDEAQRVLNEALGRDPNDFLKSLLAQMGTSPNCSWSDVIRSIDGHLGIAVDLRDYTELPGAVLDRSVRLLVRSAVVKIATSVQHKVMRLVDEPKHRLPGAKQMLQAIRDRVQAMDSEAARMLAGARDKRLTLLESTNLNHEAGSTRLGTKAAEPLSHYFLRARDESVAHLTTALIRGLIAELSGAMEQLIQFGRELEQLGSSLANPRNDNFLPPGDSSINVRPLVADGWRTRRTELVTLVQQRIKAEFADAAGGLHEVLSKGRSQELCRYLRDTARQVALEAARSIDLMGFMLAKAGAGKQETGRLHSALDAAKPQFLANGGVKHLIAILPSGPDMQHRTEEVRPVLDPDASVLTSPDNEVTMCYEGAGVSLAHLAVNLIQGRRDYLELAARVHTRHDIEWLPLAGLTPVITAADTNATPAAPAHAGSTNAVWSIESEQSVCHEPSANAL